MAAKGGGGGRGKGDRSKARPGVEGGTRASAITRVCGVGFCGVVMWRFSRGDAGFEAHNLFDFVIPDLR